MCERCERAGGGLRGCAAERSYGIRTEVGGVFGSIGGYTLAYIHTKFSVLVYLNLVISIDR